MVPVRLFVPIRQSPQSGKSSYGGTEWRYSCDPHMPFCRQPTAPGSFDEEVTKPRETERAVTKGEGEREREASERENKKDREKGGKEQ